MPEYLAPTRSHGLVEILDRVLDKGLVIAGDIKINLANVELLTIQVRLLVCSIDKAEAIGLNWWRYDPRLTAAERLLTGADLSDESLASAANEIGALEALDDAHTSGLYRKRVAGVLLVRALRQAATRARAMAAA